MLSSTEATDKWALAESEFAAGLVGGKSLNLAELRKQLSSTVALPTSVALPFGTFERVLEDAANTRAAAEATRLLKALEKSKEGVPAELAQLRQTVATQLHAPAALVAEVSCLHQQLMRSLSDNPCNSQESDCLHLQAVMG